MPDLTKAAQMAEAAASLLSIAAECAEPESVWHDPRKAQGYRIRAEGLLQDVIAELGFKMEATDAHSPA